MLMWLVVGTLLIIVLVVRIVKLVQKGPGGEGENGYPPRDGYPLAALRTLTQYIQVFLLC